jgi:hypothetical protein
MQDNGDIAAKFSLPTNYQTIQLKRSCVGISRPNPTTSPSLSVILGLISLQVTSTPTRYYGQ